MTHELEPNASRAGTRHLASPVAAALPEIDALRGVAIIAVSGLHVSFGYLTAAPAGGGAATWALIVHLLMAYGAPLFVALSMAGLALGYDRPSGIGAGYRTFLARRAQRILPAYVFWTILTVLRNDPASLWHPDVLARLLVCGSAAYHLYFVPLICEYYLLWPVFSLLAAWARRGSVTALALAAGGLTASLAVWRAAGAGLVSNALVMLPLFWLGYATLGIAVAPALARYFPDRHHPRLPRLAIATLAAATAAVMVLHVRALLGPAPDAETLAIATTIFQLPTMAYTLAAMALAVALVGSEERGMRMLRALGRRSYGIYLAHVLVLEFVCHRVFGRPGSADFTSPTWMVEMLAEWALCLALTSGLLSALERVPGLARFAGSRPPERALTPPAPAP